MEMSVLIPLIECLVFSKNIYKPVIKRQIKNHSKELLDDYQFEAACNALAEKYNSEFYGIEFVNTPVQCYFRIKSIEKILNF